MADSGKDDKYFTARDVKRLAGLSYRQLNDWDARGAMPGDRTKEGTWRKFSPKEMFSLMICGEIRQRYGIPVEKTRYVHNFMMAKNADHLAAAIRLMEYGLSIYLLTDFAETFVMDSDLEFADLMELGYFRPDQSQAYVLIRVNDIVNRLLAALKEPVKIEPDDDLYRFKGELDLTRHVHTQAELDLLQAVRSRNFDQISITVKPWGISEMKSEQNIPQEQIVEKDGTTYVAITQSFETFSVSHADGKMVRARRQLPMKYSEKENRPVMFVGVYEGKGSDSNKA